MADENTLKRINEILKEGIEATGIDADPSANNYATDYPTEHGDLIRELEDIGTLDELQDLQSLYFPATVMWQVSPRYLKSTPPLNEYGEEFGARGAYGITTEELLQPQIQDVIKQNLGIDTPTNVVDDIDKLDFETPDITLNPDGSTTERTPNMILNENVPKECNSTTSLLTLQKIYLLQIKKYF